LRMPEVGEWPLAERLRYEKEALGLFLSGHPVEEYLPDADRMRVTPSERLATLAAEKEVSLLGMISTLKVIKTKKGDKMAFAQLEDMSGSVEAVFFPEAFARAQAVLASDQPVVVRGKMDRKTEENKGGGLKILADSAEPAEAVRERTSSRVCLRLPIHCISRERVDKLKELLPKHSGKCELRLIVEETGRFRAPLRVPEALRVAATRGLKNELRALFSDDAEVVFE